MTHLTLAPLQYKQHIRFTISAGGYDVVATMIDAVSLAGQLKLFRLHVAGNLLLILAITVCESLMTARDSFHYFW